MDELLNEQLKRIEKERKHRLRWVAGVMILAIIVSFFTTDALTLSGTAKVNMESVLSCDYRCHSHTADCYDEAGSLVCGKADYCLHSHTADCYDYYGVLVCPLPELAPHVHGESCYEERRELVCALEEGEEHLHGEDCYEMARVLCCGLEERVPHAHGAECYAADGALVCGLPELEAHVHGEECLVTVELSPEEAAYRGMLESGMPPQRFQGELKDLRVTVEAEADTFPAETEMRLSPVPAEKILDAVSETLEREAEDLRLQAVDIAFFAPDGTELEPAKPVRVTLEAAELAGLEEPLVVHVDGEGEARVVEQEAPPTDELVFEAEGFSVYAVVYTVDFYWEVDGEEFAWSLPGGSLIRLAELAEALGIVPASEEHTEAERFAANVASLAVSDPTLLWAGKPETDMSLGELWESLGGVEPSGELTGEELAALAAAPVKAGDWVLLSLRPFTSEESLRVTMTNGDEFTLRVTDAQGDVTLSWPNMGNYGRNGTIRLHFADKDGNDITDTALKPDMRSARLGDPTNEKEISRVIWDLGDNLLVGGATYSVSFTVWPDQEAYDLVADLNNGKRTIDSLTEIERAQVEGEHAPFTLKTNTAAAVSYTPVKEVTDANGDSTKTKGTPDGFDLIPPAPVPLDDTTIRVEKTWTAALDPAQLEHIQDVTAELALMRAGEEKPYIDKIVIAPPLPYQGETTWPELSMFLLPGCDRRNEKGEGFCCAYVALESVY